MKKTLIVVALVAVVAAAAIGVYVWRSGDSNDVTAVVTKDEQRSLKTDPASVEARRQQYLAQYQQLWRVDDYATVRKKAQDGNPIAQRRLYEIYEHCMGMRAKVKTTLSMLGQMATLNKNLAVVVQEIQSEYQRLCSQNGAGNEANGQTRAFWLRQSAKSGDLVSQIRVFAGENPQALSANALKDFMQRAAASGDPAAIMEIGTLLPLLNEPWPDQATAPAVNSEIAGHAWILTACRAGMDCNRGSRLMTTACMRVLSCLNPNYEALMYNDLVSTAKRQQIEALVVLIRNKLLKPGLNP